MFNKISKMSNNTAAKVSEINISYNPKISDLPSVVCSVDAYMLFLDYFPKNTIQLQERVVVMYLNRAQKVLGIYLLSIGGMASATADLRLIFSVALKTAATRIM